MFSQYFSGIWLPSFITSRDIVLSVCVSFTLIFDTAYFPKALPGEYIICDIQNAYYDKDELRKNFEAAGLKFESSSAENEVEIRKIFDGKNLIEEISISQNEVKIQNFLRGYSYQLVNAEDF